MKPSTIALVGNPNCGKTTLFNALTGARQREGNWPGVTVERKTGEYHTATQEYQVVDLPGLYSFVIQADDFPLDFCIACDYVLSDQADLVINVLDATNLERHLFLTTQLMEMNVPLMVVINMTDLAEKRGMVLDAAALQKTLNCPVIAISGHKKSDINRLKKTIDHAIPNIKASKPLIDFDPLITQATAHIGTAISQAYPDKSACAARLALRFFEGDDYALKHLDAHLQHQGNVRREQLTQQLPDDPDIMMASERYDAAHAIAKSVIHASKAATSLTQRLDAIVLNRFLGIPIFLGVMYLMFLVSINMGGVFQDFFDLGSEAIFVHGLSQLLTSWHFPAWLNALLSAGLGKGINTTITFIPILGSLFLFLSFLEATGYMARAAFVMDRLMRALGLPGKSFVPLIVGFGCNVPAIMATRTLDKPRDRILTVLMSPFMSCGARLAIYAVFVAAFFPHGGQNIVFALYLIGVLMAVLTGLLLRKTVLQGSSSPLVMEMPPYLLPKARTVFLQVWTRLKQFLLKAGKVIVPVCMVLGMLNAMQTNGHLNVHHASRQSVLASIGRAVTPVFSPMGIKQDNWPATVGLLTGTLAKEVVVGTLNTLYTQEGHLQAPYQAWSLRAALSTAWETIPANLEALPDSLRNPVKASAPTQSVNHAVYGIMYLHFGGAIAAFAYLLFILLYMPCVSATAAILRELTLGWTVFSVLWSTGVAYGTAVAFYQVATWAQHPFHSFLWVLGIATAVSMVVSVLYWRAQFWQSGEWVEC